VNLQTHNFGRLLVLAAHPDDETIGCSGLLQRCAAGLVVFAVDGAPPHYGFERKYGSLRDYSDLRFGEAARALRALPHVSFRRLQRRDGSFFLDQHLFLELPEVFACLKEITRNFAPEVVVSHAFEGGHIDHDACHVLARTLGPELGLPGLEFPLYWRTEQGKDVLQEFRERVDQECVLQLSQQELQVKREMVAQYQSQQGLTHVFPLDPERFRPMARAPVEKPRWSRYPFENRRRFLKADAFLRRVAEFEQGFERQHQPQNTRRSLWRRLPPRAY
jgi:N-acetylglucosamine malate deacetylase 2